jgi:CBS domain-containing protein
MRALDAMTKDLIRVTPDATVAEIDPRLLVSHRISAEPAMTEEGRMHHRLQRSAPRVVDPRGKRRRRRAGRGQDGRVPKSGDGIADWLLARRKSMRLSCLAVAFCASVIAISRPGESQQATLDGMWNGGGTVILPSGDRERARCRATFKTRSANRVDMSAVCSTASTRIAQSGQLARTSANRFSGELYNPEYGVSGSIVIVVQGSRLTASVNGGGGMANFTLTK